MFTLHIYFNVQSLLFAAKGFVQCKRSDPKLGECIKNSLQSAIPHLTKGKKYFLIVN